MEDDDVEAAAELAFKWYVARSSGQPIAKIAHVDDPRFRAAREIEAIRARRDSLVAEWRKENLDDGPLAVAAVEQFIGSRLVAEEAEVMGRLQERPGDEIRYVWLAFWPAGLPIQWSGLRVLEGGSLDQLREVAEHLSSRFEWLPHDATMFVLTDETPPAFPLRGYVQRVGEDAIRDKVVIEVDPRVPVAVVARVYRAFRGSFGAARRIDERTARLAVFVEQHELHTNKPWRQALEEWNQTYPDDRIAQERRFATDAAEAWQRVMDSPLQRPQKEGGVDGQ
jgi:hypothetical protein